MRRCFPELSEIVRRCHDAATEQMMPNTIGVNPRGERIVTIDDLLREPQSPAAFGQARRLRIDCCEKTARHSFLAWVCMFAPDEQRRVLAVNIVSRSHPLRPAWIKLLDRSHLLEHVCRVTCRLQTEFFADRKVRAAFVFWRQRLNAAVTFPL